MLRYPQHEPPGAGAEGPLFVIIENRRPSGTQDLRKLVHVVSERGHRRKPDQLHMFRHSFTTNTLIRGAQLLAIKEQLGHVFVATTMVHLHAVPTAMRANTTSSRRVI